MKHRLTDRPYYWQDRIVVRVSLVCGLIGLYLVIWP